MSAGGTGGALSDGEEAVVASMPGTGGAGIRRAGAGDVAAVVALLADDVRGAERRPPGTSPPTATRSPASTPIPGRCRPWRCAAEPWWARCS